MMNIDTALFLFALTDTGFLLFLSVYFLINLSDLDCDYINSRTCCSKLNPWLLPEVVCHGLLTILLIATGHYIFFIINLPMIIWLAYRYFAVPKGNLGLFDPTEIFHKGNIKKFSIHSAIILFFHLIHFFAYLYCLIISLLIQG